jgi:hypothetical protein
MSVWFSFFVLCVLDSPSGEGWEEVKSYGLRVIREEASFGSMALRPFANSAALR